LDEIITKLHEEGVEFLSTGGTRQFIESLGFPCKAVEDLTGYPSILGGRVKTLHPKVFGGILCRRGLEQDIQQIEKYEIPEIDLVIVDLYPFEATVASGADDAAIIEKIDIGGISLIRGAAKNYNDVVIIASQAQYKPFRDMLLEHGATTTLEERRWFAKEAFAVSSHYDSAILGYFDGGEGSAFRCAIEDQKTLRYGENPHQKGYFFGDLDKVFDQIHGKEISYNNLLDINAAIDLIDEFNEVTFAVLKHNNACGLASRPTVLEAWKDALAGDPVSAFGGVLVTNAVIDKATAEEVNKIFFEVIIAPDYDVDALEILGQKKNRIILVRKQTELPKKQFRSLLNGVLVQDKDTNIETPADLKQVSTKAPTEAEVEDMLFANKIVKNSKSNAIVLAKGKQLLASGVGQTSRVDALKQAIDKAKSFGFDLHGAVMASDAFFPFPDCVEIADKEGVTAVIQPGGSVKDQLTFDYCNEHGVAMVTTGIRHFKH
jgi:phosphoribosylaminoimidazolecarboxamide formyltransferase/IMP cyclohydrolase